LLYIHDRAYIEQIDDSVSCGCPVIDHEFCRNIVKVAADPRGDSRGLARALGYLTHLASELSGFTRTSSLKMNEKFNTARAHGFAENFESCGQCNDSRSRSHDVMTVVC